VDDRILLIPFFLTPDPAVFERWPAVGALLRKLRAFLPVDIFLWPSLKGQEVAGSGVEIVRNAWRRQLQSEHHVLVSLGGSDILLEALAERPVRSLVVGGGYMPTPKRAAVIAGSATAAYAQAMMEILRNDSEAFHLAMSGAEEADIQRAMEEAERNRDREVYLAVQDGLLAHEPGPITTLEIPALFLSTAWPTGSFEIFRCYIPTARYDELKEWGPRLHEEAGGYELADKVIPFIQEVIAQREAAGQT
jgi:hypothetical protein